MDQRAFVPSRLTIKRLGVVALVLGLSAPAQAGWKRATKTSEGIVVDVRKIDGQAIVTCLLYTSPSPRDATLSRMPSSA